MDPRDPKLERPQDQRSSLPFDPDFKLSANHRFIFQFAKERGGLFDREAYRTHLAQSGLAPKMQKQMLRWNETTTGKLSEAGYLRPVGQGKYRLVPSALDWAERPVARPGFTPGKNHSKLLRRHKDGIIHTADLYAEHKDKPEKERRRQTKMTTGMLNRLTSAGYLTKEEHGVYRLTEQGHNLISLPDVPEVKKKRETQDKPPGELKITAFDQYVLAVCDETYAIRPDYIAAHPRGASVQKRITTLTQAGLIRNNALTPELIHRIDMAVKLKRGKALTPDLLSPEQRQVMTDIRTFLNLTPGQVLKHIYKGNADLFNSDMNLLLRQDILEKNTTYGVYIVGEKGRKLLYQMDPDIPLHKSKVYTRPAEVGHDALVYSAFKQLETQLTAKGCVITDIVSDRQLRSQAAKKHGHMKGEGEYPDLRIHYQDADGIKMKYDIEVDCGYDSRTIGSKLSAFFASSTPRSFAWCCNSIKQAIKVSALAGDHSKHLKKHRPLTITYMDAGGNWIQIR